MSACLAFAFSAQALGGGCPPGGTGPDVVVGEITGPSNYTSVGGIEALTIGTTSCNVGDQNLLWISNSNQHPVIGQNLFRLHNVRFEQIGQAWLKHGFFALQQNACGCGCNSSGTGSALGVGCSDPYGSGLNGDQNGMGPKWEVNANKGLFTWPPDQFSNTGNSIFKRLQVAISDIDPGQIGAGAEYFAEAQYVSPDDATAGNQDNNASYRGVNVSGGGSSWSFSLTGSTQQTLAGIRAWKDNDPSVTETDVNVPGDGLVIIAVKTTDLGGGQWSYEYAVQNLNCHRSISSFSVPCPSSANVSGIGFHDVDYHSGEPWDGTDWTGQHVVNEVVWNCPQTFDQNPNANALRWGTLYNFRFVADVQPATTDITMGLFKPPGDPTVTASSIGPEQGIVFESLDLTHLLLKNGTLLSNGTLSEIENSDDVKLMIASEIVNSRQRAHIIARLNSPNTTVQEMNLNVELMGVLNHPNTKCAIYMRNWATNKWDKFETFLMPTSDTVKSYLNIANPSDYIRSTNGDVRVRVLGVRGNAAQPFELHIDQIEVEVAP